MRLSRPSLSGLSRALTRVSSLGGYVLTEMLLFPLSPSWRTYLSVTSCFPAWPRPFRALALAPVSVAPEHQRKAIGRSLIEEGLQQARKQEWDAVFALGDPAYYGRFGFRVQRHRVRRSARRRPDGTRAWRRPWLHRRHPTSRNRQRHAKSSNIAPRSGSVSVGRYSSTAVLPGAVRKLAAPAANSVGLAISVGLEFGSAQAQPSRVR